MLIDPGIGLRVPVIIIIIIVTVAMMNARTVSIVIAITPIPEASGQHQTNHKQNPKEKHFFIHTITSFLSSLSI
jgi:hypothetical protein